MNQKKYWMGMLIPLLAACQGQDLPTATSEELLPMQLEASIEQSGQTGRTVTSATDQSVSFASGDKIGLFVPDTEHPVVWTYNGSLWNAASSVFWKDKQTSYRFYAYYPAGDEAASAVCTQVPMPDLSSQSGTLEDIGKYDFLVASTECDYTTSSGSVAFTGDQQFKHVLSMVSFTFHTEQMGAGTALKSVTLSSTALSAKNSYDLQNGQLTAGGETAHAMTAAIAGGKSVMLVNPISSVACIVNVTYTVGGTEFTISKESESLTLAAGSNHTMSVTVKQGSLNISAATVAPWGDGGTLSDITVE